MLINKGFRMGKEIAELNEDGLIGELTIYGSINAAKRANRKNRFQVVEKHFPAKRADDCQVNEHKHIPVHSKA